MQDHTSLGELGCCTRAPRRLLSPSALGTVRQRFLPRSGGPQAGLAKGQGRGHESQAQLAEVKNGSAATNALKRGKPAARKSGVILKGVTKGRKANPDYPRCAEHAELGPLRVTYGSKASYITFKDATTTKPKLLIQIGMAMSPEHGKICGMILQYAAANTSTKEQCIEYRAKLLAQQ